MKRVPIDWARLALAFDARAGASENFLDTATGEIITMRFAQMWEDDIRKIRARIGADDAGRYRAIPPLDARVALRAMADFARAVLDARLRRALLNAVQGRRAFDEFKEVLQTNAPERARWYAFKDARTRERIRKWMEENGIEASET